MMTLRELRHEPDCEKDTKKGKLPTSHRYNPVPLLRSRPDGVPGELVV